MGDQIKRLREQFAKLDEDDSGTIEITELVPMLTDLGINCTDRQLKKHFMDIDEDGSGTVDWVEFVTFVFKLGEDANSLEAQFTNEQLTAFGETFALFDKNGDGCISSKELGKIMKKLG